MPVGPLDGHSGLENGRCLADILSAVNAVRFRLSGTGSVVRRRLRGPSRHAACRRIPTGSVAPKPVGSIECGFVAEIDAAGAALTLVGSWGIDQTARDTLPTQVGAMYVLALTVDGHGLPDQQAVAQTAARWVADAWIARHSVMSRRVPGQI